MRASARQLALRGASRRRHQGGAAMFVVSITLAVLASVGVFALAAASTELKTSGNERQAMQTHYLAEYGVIGAAHALAEGRAALQLSLMLNPAYRDHCVSLPLPSTTDPVMNACRRIEPTDLQVILQSVWVSGAQVTTPYTATAGAPYSSQTPGSFGLTPMAGGFFVELTNPIQTSAARYSLAGSTGAHMCFIQFTASSAGVTNSAALASEGIEMQRARIVAGPVNCPW